MIELKNVRKIYQMGKVRVPALRGLDLTIEKGGFVAVMGPSGSGKSTMMHIIGCLDLPTEGQLLFEGTDVSKLNWEALAEIRGKKVGFVFQTFNLIPALTALENVELPLVFQGIPRSERQKRAKELLERVGLGDRAGHRPSELSGGEQQRAAIARALANDPEIILADEPTGNLDSESGRMILEILKELNEREGVTIVLVTHDPGVAQYAKRIIHLRDGRRSEPAAAPEML